jgi:hypothetical protein
MKYIKTFEYNKSFSQLLKIGDIFILNVNSQRKFVVEVIDITYKTYYYDFYIYSVKLNIILTYSFKRNKWIIFEDKSSDINPLASYVDEHGEPLPEKEILEIGDLIDDYKTQIDANKYNL